MSNNSKVFTLLVVGDNPEAITKPYSSKLKVDKYIKYKYEDAPKMKQNSIRVMSEIIKNPKTFNLSNFHSDYFMEKIKDMKSMSDFEYYSELTTGLYIDDDGNAWSTENKDAKFDTCKIGDNFSLPFILLDGSNVHGSVKKGDVDWGKMHMSNTSVYELVWDLVHGKKSPSNDYEQKLYDNMFDKMNYFSKFNNVDQYVIHNCAYWNYAYLDSNGWVDVDNDSPNDFKWVSEYYERFIEPLSDDTTITVFECSKK